MPNPPEASPATSGVGDVLPNSVLWSLSAGYLGMSALVNLINSLLVFFYLPPDNAGLPALVTDATILGILNVVALIAAAGRLTDSITDPLIASWSDRSTNPRGRRIPFMGWGMIPAALATALMFFPPVGSVSNWNIVWLLGIQVLLYVSLTAYITPAFALVADLGATPEERLRLSTWNSMAWALGLILAAMTLLLAGSLTDAFGAFRAWQVAVAVVCAISLIFMAIPVFTIDESKWVRNKPSTMPLKESLTGVLQNEFFRFYALADFAYFGGLAIIQTGILFYITVLLQLDEWVSTLLILVMVVVSAFLFPLVAKWARQMGGGKRLVVIAFLMAAVVFLSITAMGVTGQLPFVQAVVPIAVFAMPFAILSVLPQWILADIAEHAVATGGEAQAGMFYATRTFLQKLATTLGVVMFALLLQFGRDVGDDLGIRLTAVGGAVLYLIAALLFSRYDEERLQSELRNVGELSEFNEEL